LPAYSLRRGAITNLGKARVQVRLSESDLQRLDQDQPVFVMLLDEDENEDIDADEEEAGFAAEPDEAQDFDDIEDDEEGGTKALYYVVNATDNRLVPGKRVLVRLSLAGNEKQRLVITYAAVIYGVQGETWVYTLSEALNYVRYPINIEYIEGGLAVLSEGPPPGTLVVTVGTAELLGAETGVSK
jgi:multidrug efflux pump subunit AcrA (membrane-fusion protein)